MLLTTQIENLTPRRVLLRELKGMDGWELHVCEYPRTYVGVCEHACVCAGGGGRVRACVCVVWSG